jgi:hypothetical protein
MLTIENLIIQLESLKNLKSLDLSSIRLFNFDDKLLLKVFASLTNNWEELKLNNLVGLRIDTLKKMLSQNINLENIKIIELKNSIKHLDDIGMFGQILSTLTLTNIDDSCLSRIEKLDLSTTVTITNPLSFAQNLSKLKHLNHLDLSGMQFQRSFSSPDTLNACIGEFACHLGECCEMKFLNVSYCDFLINDEFMKIICRRMKKLVHLDVRSCSKLTDTTLHFIFTYLLNLEYLDLSWCQSISDKGLSISNSWSTSSKDSSLINSIDDQTICKRTMYNTPFKRLKLKAEADAEIDALNLEEMKLNSKKSIQKSLSEEKEIDENVSIYNLKNLKVLKMESCRNISDKGLLSLFNILQMREIDVKLCSNITGEFLKYSALTSSLNCLRILNLNQCSQLNESYLIDFLKRASYLKELNVSGISSISDNLIDTLLNNKHSLRHFDVSFCSNVTKSKAKIYEQFLYDKFGASEFNFNITNI